MVRLFIHVEGETEEEFVREILRGHLCSYGYDLVVARLIGNARQRKKRGGIRGWDAVSRDILDQLKKDSRCLATTMVDYYGIPVSGPRAWPGRRVSAAMSVEDRALTLQRLMMDDIRQRLPTKLNANRFLPFAVMHEFEGLLFSNCEKLADVIGHPKCARKLQEIRNGFESPEEINDSSMTCPSKRILNLVPSYQKPLLGPLAVLEIGLGTIREQCPLFHQWLTHLEQWPEQFSET